MWRRCVAGAWRLKSPVENNSCFPSATLVDLGMSRVKIPVIFHNLHGYDSHFIMQQIGEIAKRHAYTNKKGEKARLQYQRHPQ